MPDVGRVSRGAGAHDDRQAPEVQAARAVLGRQGEDGQLSRVPVAAAIALVVGALGGCSSELTAADLATAYRRSHPEVDAALARCVVDELTLSYSVDQIEVELSRPEVSTDFAWEQYRSEALCGSTDAFVEQLTGLFIESGLSADVGECAAVELADRVTDADFAVLRSGEMTDAFYARYFDVLQACEALP